VEDKSAEATSNFNFFKLFIILFYQNEIIYHFDLFYIKKSLPQRTDFEIKYIY